MNRRRKNQITWIKCQDGQIVEDAIEIREVLGKHFQQLMTTEPIIPIPQALQIQTLAAENQFLCTTPTPEEIHQAIKNIHPLKSPGPDGYPGAFFQKHWTLLRYDVEFLINNFFSTSILPQHINHTLLTLIPKKQISEYPSDYHPIALTNTTYKVIAKIIAGRLRRLLSRCISDIQSTFISGRHIEDNIVLAREINHEFNSKSCIRPFFALKLDLSKAFDRVE